eukprot:COSAG01_NODE_55085_length_327_cov_1.228070_1_plen_22_part_01
MCVCACDGDATAAGPQIDARAR